MPMTEPELQAVLDKMKALPIEVRVQRFIALRTAKATAKKAFEAQEAEFNFLMEGIQNQLLADADAKGVTGFTTPHGTTYTAETKKISISDDTAFYGFVLARADLDFFERRVSSRHVDEYMKDNGGTPPPGLNIFREREMRVRKANEKAKD